MNNLPLPGSRLGTFLVEQNLPVAELNLTAIRLQHEPTGARMLHLACDDPNNVFAVGFRTPPPTQPGSPTSLSIPSSVAQKNIRYAILFLP